MEELQDAIEDAQYMNAMHDGVPKPTKEWKWPAADELQAYLDKIKATNPKALEAEGLCKGILGLYMFMQYCKDQGPQVKVMSEFVEEVAGFRAKVSHSTLLGVATKIVSDYLADGSIGNIDQEKKRPANLARILPESDPRNQAAFDNSLAAAASASASTSAGGDGAASNWSQYVRPGDATNAVKIVGAPLTKVLDLMRDIVAAKEANGGKETGIKLRADIFDDIDNISFAHLKERFFEAFRSSQLWTKHFQFMAMTERKVVEDDFALFRVLGRGGFGLVNACKRCDTGHLYAMKMMNKKRVKLKKAEQLCLQERNILAIIHSPYVVCLKYAFVTQTDLYLILDLMTGGDLGFHLGRKGRFSDKETKFFAARTLLGIAALHDKQIAYRDLKPENILMDDQGYTKISDLGLACKVGRSGLSGACGTRGYWAPEMLRRDAEGKRERYTFTVDWFSFGCCVYEFIYGISPFRTEKARKWGDFPKSEKADRDKAIDLAIQEMEPEFDERCFDELSRDLLRKLLHKDPKQRLGANGYTEILAHPWFATIDWHNLNTMKPPLKPSKDINMATQSEIGSFDDKESKNIKLTEEDHKIFEKWEFISKRSFQEEVVEFLSYEEKYGPIKVDSPVSGCCTIA